MTSKIFQTTRRWSERRRERGNTKEGEGEGRRRNWKSVGVDRGKVGMSLVITQRMTSPLPLIPVFVAIKVMI